MHTKAAAVIVLVACALGACGDEGDEPRSKDEKQIRATVTEALTTSKPDVCTRLATRRFAEQVSGERGAKALRSCQDEAPGNSKQSISIGRVAVSGPRASADLRLKGGQLPFKTLRLGLRKPAGRWKLDRTKSATLDRPAFFRFARKELMSPPDALSGREADCVLRRLKATKNGTIVRALLKTDLRLFAIPGAICGVALAAADSDLPRGIVVCIQRRLRRELTSGSIGRRLAANPARAEALLDSALTEREGERIGLSCVRG